MGYIEFLILVLFLLAIADLVVGVSNDAVNFLNSAIGSKVSSFRNIIITAAAGVILGSVFSSGIMEVARTGILHPEHFNFEKIILVFLAVMLTDIVLLDIFNTLGLPTSTTVSIVFELLGASLVAGVLFSVEKQEPVTEMMKYVNFESTFTIISGIFLSILIAFVSGILVQYLSRYLFTFDYEARLSRFGALYAAVGITSIVYFLLIKGLQGTTLISKDTIRWVSDHTLFLIAMLLVGGFLLSYLLQKSFGVNPLKVVVLTGTFSLAMAFAGNDLVNFIGVPITGYLAYLEWSRTGLSPQEHYQGYLASNDVIVPNYMLLVAGLIMALTLWLSSKARKVTETEVGLGSEHDGEEMFRPNMVSRSIVKSSLMLGNFFELLIPRALRENYESSFKKSKLRQATVVHDKPAFDLVRASANLVISSSLIAAATSMKLPLSTTYVSFMVAMGTSLADKAWGRESAVYRVAGVLSVIGGWFITALIAFVASGFFVFILIKGGKPGTIMLLGIVTAFITLSYVRFSRKDGKAKRDLARLKNMTVSDRDIITTNREMMADSLAKIGFGYSQLLQGLTAYNADQIAVAFKDLKEQETFGYRLRAEAIRNVRSLQQADIKAGQLLVDSTDLLQDIMYSSVSMGEECLHYVQNLHQPTDEAFNRMIGTMSVKMDIFLGLVLHSIRTGEFNGMDAIRAARDDVRGFINDQLDWEINKIQHEKPGTRQALLKVNILLQSRDILAISLRIVKMYRKFSM
jgi:phosphate/sulfate permease